MTPLALGPGLHGNVPPDAYHADRVTDAVTLSRGTLVKLVDDCPLQSWAEHPRLGNIAAVKVTKKMDFGSMAHAMILGKGEEIAVFEADDWRTKASQEFKAACRGSGKIPALTHEYARADDVAKSFAAELERFGLTSAWAAGKSEVVCIWDEAEGLRCRCMFDRLAINEATKMAVVFDLKIGEVTNPKELDRHVYNQRYHIQREFYLRGLTKVRPDLAGRVTWLNCFLQDGYPFKLVPAEMNGEFEVLAKSFISRGLTTWQECIKTGVWPSYTSTVVMLAPPAYAMRDELGANALL